jgi:hypothetical protein
VCRTFEMVHVYNVADVGNVFCHLILWFPCDGVKKYKSREFVSLVLRHAPVRILLMFTAKASYNSRHSTSQVSFASPVEIHLAFI